MSDNTLTIVGNLAADPDLRYTQTGIAVATFTVMQTKREKQGDQYVDGAKGGLRVTVWRDQAENVAESLEKGSHVIVTGRMEPQQWQDRTSGETRYGWELAAEFVGPCLRFATAKPVKAQRRQQGPSGQGEQRNRGTQYGGQADYDEAPF